MADINIFASVTEKKLYEYFAPAKGDKLKEAMAYSVLDGGKRIRACLVLMFCSLHDGDQLSALPLASALEAVHAHSLVHDDLPCMDNSDMRRGKPSCHKRYGEATALLAGDGLLNKAYGIIAGAKELSFEQKARAVEILAYHTGEDGMLGGQQLDMYYENKQTNEDILNLIQSKKTGALIRAACLLGCVAAEKWDDESFKRAADYAENLGRAFQITDDILDVTSTEKELGKPVGSDEYNGKSTYVSVLGLSKAREKAAQLTQNAIDALSVYGQRGEKLIKLARLLTERKS